MQYSIVNLSEVKNTSKDFLIHAEFFEPKIQSFRKYAKNNNFQKLENYVGYIKNGIQPEYTNEGTIPVIRPVNIRENEITDERREYVSNSFYKENIRGQIKYNDILLTVSGVGTLGRSIIFKETEEMFLSVDNVILRNLKELLPEFIYIYLNSKYGQQQINILYKGTSGIIHLYPDDIKEILIKPLKIQSSIAELVNKSYTLRQSADTLYKEAEDILLEELGFKDYQIKNQKCFVKNLSDTQKVSRIDAEYFQPKYEYLINKIKEYKGGYFQFEDQDIKDKNFTPKKGVLYKYIELANIGLNCDIHNIKLIDGDELPTRARRIVKENDVILSSVEGSLNSISLINKNLDGALCSTGFFVIESKKIPPQTLLILLKSVIGQMQLKRGCSGTILTAISKDELKNIKFPLLPESIQSIISSKLQQSFLDRQKSLDLLAVAKGAVEVAVEDGEDVAFGYIDNNL